MIRISKNPVNIREKLAELERPIGLNGQALMATDTPQQAFDLLGAGRTNLLINGDFKISQRGDYTTSAVTAGHDTYWLDRWLSLKDGTTSTVRRITTTVNGISQYAARIECTSAGSGIMGFAQKVELSSIPVGRTLTVSAWVRTNHPFVGFRTNSFQGSGGDRGVKVNPNGSWQRIYWTFDSTGTTSGDPDILIVAFNNAAVSIAVGNYIEIAEVQLEVGKVATPFEYRSYGQELALCQRYYQKSYPYEVAPGSNGINNGLNFAGMVGRTGMSGVTSSGEIFQGTKLYPTMRVTPNIIIYDRLGNPGRVTGTNYLVADTDNLSCSLRDYCSTGFQVSIFNLGTFSGISYHYIAAAEL
jgi:hypothetical protein